MTAQRESPVPEPEAVEVPNSAPEQGGPAASGEVSA